MHKFTFVLLFGLLFSSVIADAQSLQASDSFFLAIKKHCGKSYEGEITTGAREGDGFSGKRLVMQVISCEENQIKIPFYVGDDSSRTWVFTMKNNIITLEHDHRHKDGTPDKITMYGGTSPNQGTEKLQFFPANSYTCNMLYYACSNVWWVTINEEAFTYNLRRIGSERVFTVTFNLKRPIPFEGKPWGWK